MRRPWMLATFEAHDAQSQGVEMPRSTRQKLLLEKCRTLGASS